jgi:hypothetical protein
MSQLLATLCVALSLTLGGSNQSSEFRLRRVSFSRTPLAIDGLVGDMVYVSLVVTVGAMREE